MSNATGLFKPEELIFFQRLLKQHLLAAAKSPVILALVVFQTAVLSVAGYLEFEIVYRVFEFLDNGNGYWSPGVMGLTGAVMIVGFHVLGTAYPDNLATRFVKRCVQVLIPIYMIGVGALIAAILDVGSIIGTELPPVLGELPEPVQGNWLESLFSNITNPLAAIVFNIGLGGLALVNIFVAHHLIGMIWRNGNEAFERISRLRQAMADYAALKDAHKRYGELQRERAKLDALSDDVIRMDIGTTTLNVRDENLLPHKELLVESQLNETSAFGPKPAADPAKIARLIKPIEAITLDQVLRALVTPKSLEKLS